MKIVKLEMVALMHKMDILTKNNMNNKIQIGGPVYYEFFLY